MTEWLIDTLIATSALMVLVLVLRGPVGARFGARAAYALWLIPAARFFMPPVVRTIERAGPVRGSGIALPREVAPLAPAAPETLIDQVGGWEQIGLAVWLAGAALMLAHAMNAYWRQRRSILGEGVQVARLGRIRILRSERVRGPLALGIIDPVVVLPFDFDDRFSPAQRRLALDHELAHHRSGDLVANIIAFVLLCLQWFNPLAWASHAAFRFDQEAACDSRVLDKANLRDRGAYGLAIAKAASGRTLLFAGALDRPSTLSRRLILMTNHDRNDRRMLGAALIAGALLIILPLSATRADRFVEVLPPDSPLKADTSAVNLVPASAPAFVVPAIAVVTASGEAKTRPPVVKPDGTVELDGGVTLGRGDVAFLDSDQIIINGKIKKLEEMTPAERATLRRNIERSRRELAGEAAELPKRLAEARSEIARIRSGEFRREIEKDRRDLERDLAEIDREAAMLRMAGEDPERIKAEIRQSLREIDLPKIEREIQESLADLNPDKLVAEVRDAQLQMERLTIRLDQLERR